MMPERWKRIEELLHEALARAPGERSTFLLEECAEDEPIRREVESLLAHHAQAANFMEAPLAELAADLISEERTLFAAGQSIGHYRVISPYGAGGMGEVYLAVDTRLERKVALKVLPAIFTSNPARLLRFEQEAKAVAALNHPNIITIHEIAQAGEIRFMATEFVEGQTLSKRMAAGRMELVEALDVATQTAAALAAAHDAGIIHRDIKPDNIMLRQDGLVKVLDFGLAKLIERNAPPDLNALAAHRFKTDSGLLVGTPHYMSPEQARGQDLDARTDIFSLGIVMFEMMAGCLPFEGASSADVIAAILTCEPPPLSRFAPGIPSELEQIVTTALAKDREERFATIAGLLPDLRNLKQELEYGKSNRQHQEKDSDLTRSVNAPKSFELDSVLPGALLPIPDYATARQAQAPVMAPEAGQALIKHYGRIAVISFLSLVAWLAAFGYAKREHETPKPAPAKIQRIAVLPFANFSGDPSQEYFADGLTDDLITTLGQIKAFNVISRTTMMRFKGSKIPLPEIARQINAGYLIEASTVRAGNRVRINVRLMEAPTERPTWSASYDREVSDILALQDDIARAVAREVSVKLSPAEEGQLNRRESVDPEAYDAYKMGQFHFNKRTVEGYRASIKYYKLAIAKNPNYALAYTGLAFTYSLSVYSLAGGLPNEEAISEARAAAEKALELDPTQAQAHAALGFIGYRHDLDWAGAENELRRAIELNPNYSEGYLWYGQYLAAMGRNSEAHASIKTAYSLDPMSPSIRLNYALSLARERDFDESIRMHLRSIEISGPGQWNTYLWMGTTYEQMGRYPEAIAAIQKAVEISGGAASAKAVLGHAYALSGMRIEAEKILSGLERSGNEYLLAYMCAGLGRKDEAINRLEKLYKGNRTGLFLLKTQWIWDPLRSDPRFQNLLRRLGFPPDTIEH